MSNLTSFRGLSDRKEPTFRGWMLIPLLCHSFNTDFLEFACQAYWIIIPITIRDGLAWNLEQTFTVSREPTYTVDPQHHREADICGFKGTVSLTTEWIALESCSDFHRQQRIVILFFRSCTGAIIRPQFYFQIPEGKGIPRSCVLPG